MATIQQFAKVIIDNAQPLTIQAGQSQSNTLVLGGCQLRALAFPANFTASNISIISNYNGAQYNLRNFDGSGYSIPVTAFYWLPLIASQIDGIFSLSITSSIVQTQTVNVYPILGPIYQGVHN